MCGGLKTPELTPVWHWHKYNRSASTCMSRGFRAVLSLAPLVCEELRSQHTSHLALFTMWVDMKIGLASVFNT